MEEVAGWKHQTRIIEAIVCAWFPLLNANQRAFQANQKPWSEIPKSWGLLEQKSYTAFTRPFLPDPI